MARVYYNQAGIARMWGISTERVGQLRSTHEDFPSPAAWLAGPTVNTPLWVEADLTPWRQRQLARSWR